MTALLSHEKLRKEMKERALKQEPLAEKLDISVRHLRNLRSKDTNVSVTILKRLSIVFEVSMDDLLIIYEEAE